jgi:hypothetical protein
MDSAENRARNRRVEIIHTTQAQATQAQGRLQ